MSSQSYSIAPTPYTTKRARSPPPLLHKFHETQSEDLASSHHNQQMNGEEDDGDDTEEIPLLTTQEEFIHAIKKWVATDNQLRILNARTKEAREHRQLLTQQLHQYVEDNNLDYPSIEISDGELILCEKREYSSLTFSYIDQCLSKLIKEPAHVERIMSALRENRECYLVPDIRRSQRK